MGQQAVPGVTARQIPNPRHCQLGTACGCDRRSHSVPIHVCEHGSYTFVDQSLCNGTTDAVSSASDKGGFAHGVEWIAEEAHICWSRSGSVELRGTGSRRNLHHRMLRILWLSACMRDRSGMKPPVHRSPPLCIEPHVRNQ